MEQRYEAESIGVNEKTMMTIGRPRTLDDRVGYVNFQEGGAHEP